MHEPSPNRRWLPVAQGTRFRIADLFWIMLWVGAFLTALRIANWEPLCSQHQLLRYSSALVLLFGIYGVWRRQPLFWGLLAFAGWITIVLAFLPVIAGARE